MTPLTLNLLTQERKKMLTYERLTRQVLRAAIVTCLYLLVVAGTLFAARRILTQQSAVQRAIVVQQEQATIAQEGELPAERIKQLNALFGRVSLVQRSYRKWTPLLTTLSSYVPAGVRFTTMTVDQTQHTISIRGTAATRDDLLTLQQNFTAAKELTNFSLPVSNLLERENIRFEMSMQLTAP